MLPFWLIVALAIVVGLALVARSLAGWKPSRGGGGQTSTPTEWARPVLPYTARPFLLSKGEAAFYHALRRAVGDQYEIAMKVRLSDILKCSRGGWRGGHGNRINQKHVDFVLIDPKTTKIRAAVELDDRSHNRSDRVERDGFVDAAMAAAGLPVIHVTAAAHYDSGEVSSQVSQVLDVQSDRPSRLSRSVESASDS